MLVRDFLHGGSTDPLCSVQDGLKKYITDALRKSEQKLQERRRDVIGGEILGRLREVMLGYEFPSSNK